MSFQQIYESMFGIASKLVFLYFTIKLFTIYFLYPTISKKVRATIPATKKMYQEQCFAPDTFTFNLIILDSQ